MRGLLNTAGPGASHIVAPSPLYPFLIAARADISPVLVITSSSRSAEDLVNELRELHSNVMEFPAWETLPHERLSPRSDTVAARIQTLYALNSAHSINPIVVTPVRGAIHRIIAELGKAPLMKLEIGNEQSLDELVRHLGALAYSRTDLVERRGEFAVRGGIVDLFLPLSAHPIRIDFFGDEIEDLSYFEVADQRTFEPVIGSVEIYPCRELLLTALIKARALTLKSELASAAELLEKISEGIVFEGMESLIPLLIDETETLLARMPTNTQVIFIDQERIKSRAGDLLATNEEFLNASWSNAAHGAVAPIHDGSGTYMSWAELVGEIQHCGLVSNSLSPFGSDLAEDTEFLDYSAIDPMRGDIDRTIDALRTAIDAHFTVVFATHGHGMLERYAGIFRNADLPVHVVEKLTAKPTRQRASNYVGNRAWF